ncbi:MAG: excinuclease ABC subunit UvrB [Chloroflexi bacterium]|nr:excinuclease ABC subunit UvrB [Chloroflexota bacterium]
MPPLTVVSDFKLTGDQPQAVEKLAEGLRKGYRYQTLLGVTGSGKTFTMANVIEREQRAALVIAHNKTLAAQLATELREFLPQNAVEYFVSYYDYYQPEAYVPRSDTYIEKEAEINEEIDKLRHSATRSLLTRTDVVIVASVSCIYGLGSPEEYLSFVALVKKGERRSRERLVRHLIDQQYERNDMELSRGRFRIRGDTLELIPSYQDTAVRISFWEDQVERITEMDPLTGEILRELGEVDIYPAKHFVTSHDNLNRALVDVEKELEERLQWLRGRGQLLEAARLEQRTHYDIEMLRETGYCPGIENYSRHIAKRAPGSPPWTLLDYFPKDFIVFLDESHMSVPQLRGMYNGDISRKQTLVDFGFRLPSALDNRPLNFQEFEERIRQVIFVSATPAPYEMEVSQQVVEQVIRPTGLLDPTIEVKPTRGQVDDLLLQIKERVGRGQRVLVTTLTIRMAEELSDYLREMGIKAYHVHSDIETLTRSEILRDLRLGVYDVLVGINLLREGLDLPEVSLVAILDADKEGFLRSDTSLIQTTGRAARHEEGHVIMYADKVTESMRRALDETYRRRRLQEAFNQQHDITPRSIRKAVRDITDRIRQVAEAKAPYLVRKDASRDEIRRLIKDLEPQMKLAARNLEFEKAALLRDQIIELRRLQIEEAAPGTEVSRDAR